VALSFLDSAGTAVAEACQLIATSSNIYPADVCGSAGKRAGPVLRAACVCGMGVTVISIVFSRVPTVTAASAGLFSAK
jgi:hypothetical protein